jgi:vesicular inhibitory amino acid transporter
VASVSDNSDPFSDEEAGFGFIDQDIEEELIEEAADAGGSPQESDGIIGQFDWDDMHSETSESPTTPRATLPFSRKVPAPPDLRPPEITERTERTPLLRKTISFTNTPHPRRASTAANDSLAVPLAGPSSFPARRRSSAASARSMRYSYGGQSTFGQTVRGLLCRCIAHSSSAGSSSTPSPFYWASGCCLSRSRSRMLGGAWASCSSSSTATLAATRMVTSLTRLLPAHARRSAKILAGIILSDPRLRSYADIGRKAFGPRSTHVISILFCLELFAVRCVRRSGLFIEIHSFLALSSSPCMPIP